MFEKPEPFDPATNPEGNSAPLHGPCGGLRYYCAHVTHAGCNLLGLANFFGFIGGMAAIICIIAPPARAVSLTLGIVLICSCMAVDLLWRLRMNAGGMMKLLAPHAGGAVFFIPVWAVYPILLAVGIAAVVQKG